MNHDPFKWGRPNDQVYGHYDYKIANASLNQAENEQDISQIPTQNTQQPIITGTSVVSLKFNGGVIMAADNLGSYGSLLRFSNIERLIQVGKETTVGISGDISDLQQLERILEELETEDSYDSDGHTLRAPHIHEYLSRIMYNRRTKMDPLWNSIIVGGFNDDGTPFLKYVDLLGVTYGSSTLATGFGAHLAIPLLRQLIPSDAEYVNVTEEQARECILNCMRVLFYRDARALDKFTLVTIKNKTVEFEKGLKVDKMSWKFAKDIRGYGSAQQ